MDNTVTSDLILTADRQLADGGRALGLTLSEEMRARLTKYLELLYEWNQRINLTRIAPEDAVALHFLDSLLIASVVTMPTGGYVIDIGCGAGLPGLCIAICWPDINVTLIDGTRKKITFVQHVIDTLGLTNARALHARAETLCLEDAHRHAYDIVVARAVAELGLLGKLFAPLMRKGARGVAYKGPEVEKELKGAQKELARLRLVATITPVRIPETDLERRMVVFHSSTEAARSPRSSSENH